MNTSSSSWIYLFRHSAFKFATVGVINTLLSIVVIFALKSLAGISDVPANLAGYITGLGCSFLLNRRWTFKHSGRTLPTLLRFLLVFVASYLLNIMAVLSAIHLGVNDYLAHLAGIAPYSITFYLGSRYFAFAGPASNAGNHKQMQESRNKQKQCTAPLTPASRLASYPGWFWFIASMILAASVLFYRLGSLPIAVWDEARLANNALEMAQNGLSLITTYDGKPDYWNTKPPLLIWLMSLSIKAFGPIELSVRLPSVLASMATIAMVFTFCAYYLKRPLIGFLSILLLLSTSGYIQSHGARSGDYDAMLTLWTTGFLLSSYMYLQKDNSNKALWLTLCAIGILLAFFTKTIQGLIFLPALLIYAIFQRRLFEVLKSPLVYVYGILILVTCVGYYFAREQIDPGYFSFAKANDLTGRYGTVIESHQGGPFYYVMRREYPWMVLSLVIATYRFWKGKITEFRQISIFLGLTSLFYLVIISLAATKLRWYPIPLSPLSAIIVAIALYQQLEWVLQRPGWLSRILEHNFVAIMLLACIAVFAKNAFYLNRHETGLKTLDPNQYNFFLRTEAVQRKNLQKFVLIHPGYGGGYVGPALFYINTLRADGRTVTILPPSANIPADFNVVVLCGDKVKREVESKVTLCPIEIDNSCGIYNIDAK